MRLYINNLAYSTTEQALTDAFAAFGTVTSCRIPLNKATKVVQGFGYVVMPHQAEADKAIKKLNATVLNGKKIEVRESRMKKPVTSPQIIGPIESRFANNPGKQRKVNMMGVPRYRKSQDR